MSSHLNAHYAIVTADSSSIVSMLFFVLVGQLGEGNATCSTVRPGVWRSGCGSGEEDGVQVAGSDPHNLQMPRADEGERRLGGAGALHAGQREQAQPPPPQGRGDEDPPTTLVVLAAAPPWTGPRGHSPHQKCVPFVLVVLLHPHSINHFFLVYQTQ